MTLMKQARAFGVGVVLATQNPVDIDYKAISNAGHVDGRPAADRARQGPPARRHERAPTAASTSSAVGDTISGLDKREFVLRRAGKDRRRCSRPAGR